MADVEVVTGDVSNADVLPQVDLPSLESPATEPLAEREYPPLQISIRPDSKVEPAPLYTEVDPLSALVWNKPSLDPETEIKVTEKLNSQGLNAEYIIDHDLPVDLAVDADDLPFQVSETSLHKNRLFQESARELMPLLMPREMPETDNTWLRNRLPETEDIDNEISLPELSDFESAQWGIELMGEFNWNMTDMARMTFKLRDAPLRQRVAFYNLMESYEKLPNFTWDGSMRMLKGLGTDVTTYLGAGTLAAGVMARFAAKNAGKTGLKNYLKSTMPAAVVAALEGGTYSSLDDLARQNVKVEAGAQKDINLAQTAIAATAGIVIGGFAGIVLPKGIELAGGLVTRARKGAKEFYRLLLEASSYQNNAATFRVGAGPVSREVRVSKAAKITATERAELAIISETKNLNSTAVEAEHRRIRERFPAIELNTTKKIDRKKDGSFKLNYKEIPYGFNRPKGQKKAPPEPDAKMVAKASNAMVEEVLDLYKRSKNGDAAASAIIEQQGWYKNMRDRIKEDFGSMADIFVDVIGATSAQTNVRQNWENSIEVLSEFSKGNYDEALGRLGSWLDAGKTIGSGKAGGPGYVDEHMRIREEAKAAGMSDAEAFAEGQMHFPLITKSNGKLINANSPATMLALLDHFRTKVAKGAPKTINFGGNLAPSHYSDLATIDVWAARFLRRVSGGKRIPPPAEPGVSGEFSADTETVTGEFGFGQEAFREAANKLRNNGIDLGDDDLQAIVWFLEKELWTRKGYTTRAGEGGSLEFEAAVAGISDRAALTEARKNIDTDPTATQRADIQTRLADPGEMQAAEARITRVQELDGFIAARTPTRRRDWVKDNYKISDNDEARKIVAELRSEVTVLNRENKKREGLQPRLDRLTENKETATAAGEEFIEENAAPVRRMTAGVSLDRDGDTATDSRMLDAAKRMAAPLDNDPEVLMAKEIPAIGRYIDEESNIFDKRSFDIEYIARADHNPDDFVKQLVQEAKDANQDSVFLSEVVKPGTMADANPGLELTFDRILSAEDVKKFTLELDKQGLKYGFTFVTDFKAATRARGGAEGNEYTGLRIQYIPELAGDAGKGNAARDMVTQGIKLVKDYDFVARGDYREYDTEIWFNAKGDYDAELTGSVRNSRRAGWRR